MVKRKVHRYAVSIKWPRANPPLDAVVDMLRYSSTTIESWGRDEKKDFFWMNLELDYSDMNLLGYKDITYPRWKSFGFTVHDGERIEEGHIQPA